MRYKNYTKQVVSYVKKTYTEKVVSCIKKTTPSRLYHVLEKTTLSRPPTLQKLHRLRMLYPGLQNLYIAGCILRY